jgi:hypothetical protein
LPAHSRSQLVREQYLQTTTGFTTYHPGPLDDPRTRVRAVEVGSPAEKAGVKDDDLVVKVDGQPNSIFMDLSGSAKDVDAAIATLKGYEEPIKELPEGRKRLEFREYPAYLEARTRVSGLPGVRASVSDRLEDSVREWPRGKGKLTLSVERGSEEQKQTIDLPPFTPETVGLYPTQIYETVSMGLLILFLLAYYPFRRHDGQLLVLLMVVYSFHRFVNESLRIEPVYPAGTYLTLSQWGSVAIFLVAVGIEVFLWRMMPSRWKGEGEVALAPVPSPAPPAPPTSPP